MTKGWKKVPAAAKYYGVSVRTFRELLKQGFPHSKLPSGTILVELTAGDEWLRERGSERADGHIVDEILRGVLCHHKQDKKTTN
jgi:hypothetical protein